MWLGLEDTSSLPVSLLGISGALLTILRPSFALLIHKPWVWPVLGATGGALATVLTTVLMFFKNAWHAHPFPDYPTGMLLAMLERLPWWALAGGLLGLALRLWRSPIQDD